MEIAKIIAQVTEHYQCLTTQKRTREGFLSSDNLILFVKIDFGILSSDKWILFLIGLIPIRNKIEMSDDKIAKSN